MSLDQSASIPRRQIQDNILIELLKDYNRKGGPKRVSSKIDIQKTYDSMILVYHMSCVHVNLSRCCCDAKGTPH